MIKTLVFSLVVLLASALNAQSSFSRIAKSYSNNTMWKPDRTTPLKKGEFKVDLIVVAFPDCELPPNDLSEIVKSFNTIGSKGFANADISNDDNDDEVMQEFTIADYFKEYSQGITWPVLDVYPRYYMAPQALGYYCRYDPVKNPIGYHDDGAQRAAKLRSDALKFVKAKGKHSSGRGTINCWVYCKTVNWENITDGVEKFVRKHYRVPSEKELENGVEDKMYDYAPYVKWGDALWPNSVIQVFNTSSGATLVHEIGHCLGAPDFYHAPEPSDGLPGMPCNRWAYGPTGPAYCRWKYNAFVPQNAYPILTASGTYKLGPRSGKFPFAAAKLLPDMYQTSSGDAGPKPLGFFIPTSHPNYILCVEYCRNEDAPVGDNSARGLLVSAINIKMSQSFKGPPDLCYVYRRGDSESCKGRDGDPYLREGDSFTLESDPAARLPNRLPVGISITNIREQSDGSCIFDLKVDIPKFTRQELEYSLLPQTKLVTIDSATPTSFRAEIDVLYRGEPLKTEYGVCYGKNKDPDIRSRSCRTYPLHHRDRYDMRVIDLEPGGTYYVRGYAKNASGVRYSDNQKRITLPKAESFASRATSPLFLPSDKLINTWYIKKYYFGAQDSIYRSANSVISLVALANYYRTIPGNVSNRRYSSAARPVGPRKGEERKVNMEYVHVNPSPQRPAFRLADVNLLIKQMAQLAKDLKLLGTADFSEEKEGDKRRNSRRSSFSQRANKFGRFSEWIKNFALKLKIRKPEEVFFPCEKPEELEKHLPRIKAWILASQPVMIVRESMTIREETELRWPLDIAFIDAVRGDEVHVVFPLGCDRGMQDKPTGSWMEMKELMDYSSGAVLIFYRP